MQQFPTRLCRVGIADSHQATRMLHNLAIAGGVLALNAVPPSRFSLDPLRARKLEGPGQ